MTVFLPQAMHTDAIPVNCFKPIRNWNDSGETLLAVEDEALIDPVRCAVGIRAQEEPFC